LHHNVLGIIQHPKRKGEKGMEKLGYRIIIVSFLLIGVLFTASPLIAQTGALSVKITGTMFDRHEPPGSPTPINTTGKIVLSNTSDAGFNVAIFTNDPNSELFNAFQIPGVEISDDVEIPENALTFFGTVQNNKVAADLVFYSGKINTVGGPSDILYLGSFDNPVIFLDFQNDGPVPLYSWDFIDDGVAGNGDNFACSGASMPTVAPGFVALIERGGGCLFFNKLINAAEAGAVAAIIYNNDGGGNTFLPGMRSPTSPIAGVFIKRSDGLNLLNYVNTNSAVPGKVEFLPTNIMGMLGGTFTASSKGILKAVNLNIMISDMSDRIFVGTVKK